MVVQRAVFAVLGEPYCLWEVDRRKRNLDFLAGIDANYFDFVARSHLDHLDKEEDRQHAAMGLRIAYYHGTETLFSLIGAMLQAPDCVYAWLAKCQTGDLRTLVESISQGREHFLVRVNLDEISWDRIAKAVHAYSNSDETKARRTGELFGQFWGRLAHEFVRGPYVKEYNSIKHGFRVRPGGFGVAIGLEKEYGVSPPQEKIETIGHSDFGSTFYLLEQVGEQSKKNRSYRSRRNSVNWSAKGTVSALQLISMSIANVVSASKILNGVPPTETQFVRPSEDIDFETPWEQMPDVPSATFDYVILDEEVVVATRKQLLDAWTNSGSR
jgi:hypothetical protein